VANLIGEILVWCGEFTPGNRKTLEETGFLPCEGQLVDKKIYAALDKIVQDKFKLKDENAPGKFRLPDLLGRVPIGAGKGENLTNRALGEKIGEEVHTLTLEEMPSHSHGFDGWNDNDGGHVDRGNALFGKGTWGHILRVVEERTTICNPLLQ
jgi:microcystin-dependent protein